MERFDAVYTVPNLKKETEIQKAVENVPNFVIIVLSLREPVSLSDPRLFASRAF